MFSNRSHSFWQQNSIFLFTVANLHTHFPFFHSRAGTHTHTRPYFLRTVSHTKAQSLGHGVSPFCKKAHNTSPSALAAAKPSLAPLLPLQLLHGQCAAIWQLRFALQSATLSSSLLISRSELHGCGYEFAEDVATEKFVQLFAQSTLWSHAFGKRLGALAMEKNYDLRGICSP